MKCYDFEYDGEYLSQYGFVICKFGSGGIDTVSNGSIINFNTVPTQYGAINELASTKYDECISATFQICIDPCNLDFREVTVDEMRKIMRWLNRKGFHKFKLVDPEYTNVYFEASFNVSRVEFDGMLVGFELEMTTNSPFAHMEPVTITIDNDILEGAAEKTVVCRSDDEGYIYPKMEIVMNGAGDLEIVNEFENRTMIIKNCSVGETITLDYPVIQTSDSGHKIMDDFNWMFFRLANTYDDRNNHITISLPCTIKMTYSPIVKVGI